MKLNFAAAVGSLIVSGGLVAAATALAAPAQADSSTAFIDALTNAGLGPSDPVGAIELGQSVCPMLADSGQTTADVAARVADAGGMSLGPGTMFTGIAISIFCPGALASLGNGESPIPLSILGL